MFRVVARVLAISALATVALAADDLSQLDAEYAAQKAALLAKGSQARANAQPSISTDNGKVVITASDIAFKIGGTTITMNEMAKQAQLDSLDKATRGAVLALLNNVTVLDERQRRTSAEIGGSLKGELTKLGGAQETQFKKADSKIDSVIATLKKQDTAAVALKAAVADTKPMAKIIDTAMVTLKNFMKLNSVCATKGLVYDEKEKKCKCDAGYIYTGSNCILEPGTKTNPAKDCAAIKMMYDGAKDGKFWLKPGKNAVEAYCDMTTDGGGKKPAFEALCALATQAIILSAFTFAFFRWHHQWDRRTRVTGGTRALLCSQGPRQYLLPLPQLGVHVCHRWVFRGLFWF